MFSVVIPVFNHAPYVEVAVRSALRSGLVSEVLLVDDGSEDRSALEIARIASQNADRVRDLTRSGEGNRGAHVRLNQLVAEATQDWVAVLNSDDMFVSSRFELLSRRLARSDTEFAFGYLVIIDQFGRPIGTKRGVCEPEYPFPLGFGESDRIRRGEIDVTLANQNFIATTSNLVFKKGLAERVGGFSDFRYVHDWDFILRAALTTKGLCVPHFLSQYREHGRNTIHAPMLEIRREVQVMFGGLLRDFPDMLDRSGMREAIRGNAYLDSTEFLDS